MTLILGLPDQRPIVWIGPMGRMLPIQVPPEGFDNPLVENGVLHTPLSGQATKDVFSYKRTYSIPLDALEPRAYSWFEMLYRGAVLGPYYLLDPRRRNRFGGFVSTTGSTFATKLMFTPSGSGSVTGSTTGLPTLLPCGPVNALAPSVAAIWSSTAAGTLTGELGPTPVIPGETITFSAYILSGITTLELVPYSAAGVAGTAITTGTGTVAGSPNRQYLTYTVPTDGSVAAVQARLRMAAPGTVSSFAWQLSDTAAPEPWVIGDGVPKILVNDLPSHAENLGRYTSATLTLQGV